MLQPINLLQDALDHLYFVLCEIEPQTFTQSQIEGILIDIMNSILLERNNLRPLQDYRIDMGNIEERLERLIRDSGNELEGEQPPLIFDHVTIITLPPQGQISYSEDYTEGSFALSVGSQGGNF